MAITIRLKDKEQIDLRKKCVEVNKILIKKDLMPLRESELLHLILDKAIAMTQVSEDGEVVIYE